MIPPVIPGQSEDDKQIMVGWKNTFNMRQMSLMNLAAAQLNSGRNGTKSAILNFRRAYSTTSTSNSLDLLRKNLQTAINKDIDNVIKKYLEKFFQPAVNNIKKNLGKDSVNEEHIKEVCQVMLEEAKGMYKSSRDSSPFDYSDSEEVKSPAGRKRKEFECSGDCTDSRLHKISRKMKSTRHHQANIKWNPERIHNNTLFIMGAKANKVLGFGQTRGRLYVRHPNLLRYSGDQEDKEWLVSRNLMPLTGGKAYLMLLDDIKDLAESDDYRNNPNLQLQELKGFEVPLFLLLKIKAFTEAVRTGINRSHSVSPSSITLSSGPSTPPTTNIEATPGDDFKGGDFMASLNQSLISSLLSGGCGSLCENSQE